MTQFDVHVFLGIISIVTALGTGGGIYFGFRVAEWRRNKQ